MKQNLYHENFSQFIYKILKETCIMWAHNLHFEVLIKNYLKTDFLYIS